MPRKGIGKAIAASLASSGAKVMINSRKQDQLEVAAAEMTGEVEIFAANAGDADAGERAVSATIERFGGLDILVNNAATNPYYGRTLDVDKGRYDKTFQVNLEAPLLWCRAAWEQAFKEKPGTIVNIASVGGLRTDGGGLGIYNLTKAALIHMTRQLASELGPTRVVGIAPGLVEDRFRRSPRRQLRRATRRPPAAEAPRRPAGHRQPGHLPRQRPRQLDHR